MSTFVRFGNTPVQSASASFLPYATNFRESLIQSHWGCWRQSSRNIGVALPISDRLGDDLEFLRELELLELNNAGQGSVYTLAVPLMADWIRQKHRLRGSA